MLNRWTGCLLAAFKKVVPFPSPPPAPPTTIANTITTTIATTTTTAAAAATVTTTHAESFGVLVAGSAQEGCTGFGSGI
jgi:hypothetical protein